MRSDVIIAISRGCDVDFIRCRVTAVDRQLGTYLRLSHWTSVVVGTVALHSGAFISKATFQCG